MFNELLGAAQSVQALSTLLKAANTLSNYNEIVAAVSEVNARLMQANAVALAAQEKLAFQGTRILELEEQVKSLRDWSAEMQTYESVEVANGIFSYVAKQREGKLQSTHKLCMNCFHQGAKSVLQQSHEEGRQIGLACHRCKAKVVFRHYTDAT